MKNMKKIDDGKLSPYQLLCFVWQLSQASHPIKLGLPSA